MSRSIHQTRRDEDEARERCERGSRAALDRLARICVRLRAKREIKRRSRSERRRTANPSLASFDPESIPIEIEDRRPFVWYPASEDDIRDVLRRLGPRLPPGLRAVRLALGTTDQREYIGSGVTHFPIPDDTAGTPDPLSGRPGSEIVPGLHMPPVLGVYAYSGVVTLFAYVRDPERPALELLAPYFRVQMLSTLVHELAHHEDRMLRSVRGRWRMANRERVERYAEEREHRWLREVVVPSVESRDPSGVRRLLTWIEEHGGARLDLDDLAGDPRTHTRDGLVRFIDTLFPLRSALFELYEKVEQGVDPIAARIAFADEAHCSARYDLSLPILDAILADRPDEVDALVLRGDVLGHVGRLDEAEAALRRALELAPGHPRALHQLSAVLCRAGDWPAVVEIAAECLGRAEDCHPIVRVYYARALIETGRHEEAEAVIASMGTTVLAARDAARLRALSALRRGEFERSLAIVDGYVSRPDVPRQDALLRAIRRAALIRSGRAAEAEPDPFGPEDRDWLIYWGLADLLERPAGG
jgi:tetratricopeptide (TPR) repeat protein